MVHEGLWIGVRVGEDCEPREMTRWVSGRLKNERHLITEL